MEALGVILAPVVLALNIVLIVWTVGDAKKRGKSGTGWGFAVFFLGVFGWLLWLLTRPPILQAGQYGHRSAEEQLRSQQAVIPREASSVNWGNEWAWAFIVVGVFLGGFIAHEYLTKGVLKEQLLMAATVILFAGPLPVLIGIVVLLRSRKYTYYCPLCGYMLHQSATQARQSAIGSACPRCNTTFWRQ